MMLRKRNVDGSFGEFEDINLEKDFKLNLIDEDTLEEYSFTGDCTTNTSQRGNIGFQDDMNIIVFKNGLEVQSFIGKRMSGYVCRINLTDPV